MDKIVVRTTHLLANSASPPYLDANMAVVLPAGIPAKTTETPVINEWTLVILQPIKTIRGIIINLSKEKAHIVFDFISFISTSAKILPIKIIDMAVVHPLILFIVSLKNTGNFIWKIIIVSPMPTAIIQGWVTTFLIKSLLLVDSVK